MDKCTQNGLKLTTTTRAWSQRREGSGSLRPDWGVPACSKGNTTICLKSGASGKKGEGKGEETSNLGRGEKSEVKAAGVLGGGYQRLKEDPSCAQPRKALHFFFFFKFLLGYS